jgi:hypothetical protein
MFPPQLLEYPHAKKRKQDLAENDYGGRSKSCRQPVTPIT